MDGFPDFSTPDTAWPAYQQAEEEKLLSVYLSDIYSKVEAQNLSHCLQAASSRQQQTYMLLCLAFPNMTEKEIEQVSDLSVLRERAESTVLAHAVNVTAGNPEVSVDHINLYLPCTFFMLRSER